MKISMRGRSKHPNKSSTYRKKHGYIPGKKASTADMSAVSTGANPIQARESHITHRVVKNKGVGVRDTETHIPSTLRPENPLDLTSNESSKDRITFALHEYQGRLFKSYGDARIRLLVACSGIQGTEHIHPLHP